MLTEKTTMLLGGFSVILGNLALKIFLNACHEVENPLLHFFRLGIHLKLFLGVLSVEFSTFCDLLHSFLGSLDLVLAATFDRIERFSLFAMKKLYLLFNIFFPICSRL
jgi:hypothetical protein